MLAPRASRCVAAECLSMCGVSVTPELRPTPGLEDDPRDMSGTQTAPARGHEERRLAGCQPRVAFLSDEQIDFMPPLSLGHLDEKVERALLLLRGGSTECRCGL